MFTDTTEFKRETLAESLQEASFLTKGVEIALVDEREKPPWRAVYKASGGLSDFVKHLSHGKTPLHPHIISFEGKREDSEIDVAMQWNESFAESLHTFANTINTHEGGMHEEGFKKALTNVVNRYARSKALLKEKEDNLIGEDIREGMTAIVSVKLREPQFEGQTKTKLGNTEMRSFVETTVNDKLMTWFEEHPGEAKKIVIKCSQAAKARMAARQARDLTRRKGLLESSSLPGKLADCQLSDPTVCEIFIVEARRPGAKRQEGPRPVVPGHPADPGQDLNVEKARLQDPENTEIQALISAIGTGIGDEFDLTKARYRRSPSWPTPTDGAHIRTAAADFFFRHMRELVEAGSSTSPSRRWDSVKLGGKYVYPWTTRAPGRVSEVQQNGSRSSTPALQGPRAR